ncbi:MAG: hypothetical protein IPL97_08845 [Niastella sp.]|nr:hypothetical protein [Niastella sp.]
MELTGMHHKHLIRHLFFTLLFFSPNIILAQQKGKLLKGMYIQWGYNKEWYTKSNIHIKLSNGSDFTLHHAKAHDKPDYDAVLKKPLEISIPQYNYRFGFYLNEKHTKAIEINFDHIKYVVTDGQMVAVTGTINSIPVNGDSVINAAHFLHLEHTDGGNLLHINYVQQQTILLTHAKKRPLVSFLWKLGAGINIPRTDFTWKGDRLNNNFHIAGYNLAAEAGARLYATSHVFFEFMGKTGYVKYLNALANTTTMKGNRVRHGFGYAELIGTLGYQFSF